MPQVVLANLQGILTGKHYINVIVTGCLDPVGGGGGGHILSSVTAPVRPKWVCFSANLPTVVSIFYAKFSIPWVQNFPILKKPPTFTLILIIHMK